MPERSVLTGGHIAQVFRFAAHGSIPPALPAGSHRAGSLRGRGADVLFPVIAVGYVYDL